MSWVWVFGSFVSLCDEGTGQTAEVAAECIVCKFTDSILLSKLKKKKMSTAAIVPFSPDHLLQINSSTDSDINWSNTSESWSLWSDDVSNVRSWHYPAFRKVCNLFLSKHHPHMEVRARANTVFTLEHLEVTLQYQVPKGTRWLRPDRRGDK